MPKKRWTTIEQRSWLEDRIPAFIEAQQSKATGAFFDDIHTGWQKNWPTEAPTQQELKSANGNAERALAIKQKASEDRVKYWFHNHTRGSSSGTGTRGVLKLSAAPKLVQSWQAYQNKYYDSTLRPKVEEAWKQYLSELPEGQTPKTLFEFRNQLVQKFYEDETDDVKREVEEHRLAMKAGKMASDANDKNGGMQMAIDKLPRTLQVAAEAIAKQTGWNVSILVGGPNPRMGGRIATLAFHEGVTKAGKTFESHVGKGSFDELMSKFDEFLNASFAPNDCASRALNPASVDEKTYEDTMSDELDQEEGQETSKELQKTSRQTRLSQSADIMKTRAESKAALIDKYRKLLADLMSDQTTKGGTNSEDRTQKESPALDTGAVSHELISAVAEQQDGGKPASDDQAKRTSVTPCPVEGSDVGGTADGAEPASDDDEAGSTKGSTAEVDDLFSDDARESAGLDAGDTVCVRTPTPTEPTSPATSRSLRSCSSTQLGDHTGVTGAWFEPWASHLRDASADADWQALVSEWERFETSSPPEGRLPTTSRPEEIHWWIKRKKPVGVQPQIDKPSEFGAMWKSWWIAMQPAWREGDSLVKSAPVDVDWVPLMRGGSNGLSLVVVALSWWICAVGVPDSDLLLAIGDVRWVISELVAALQPTAAKTGVKRPAEPSPDERPRRQKS